MKQKLGIVVDSTSGLTKSEANSLGIELIPHIININGKDYLAGLDLDHDELFGFMDNKETEIKTALPNGKVIEEALKKALESYEKIIVVSLSAKFSGTQNAIRMIVENNEEFKGNVFVHDGEFSSPWVGIYVKEMVEVVKEYEDPQEFMALLDKANKYMVGYLTPGNIWWFYKGGRITKMQYVIGSIAKIIPILTVADGEIVKSTTIKVRGKDKAMDKMAQMVQTDIVRLGLSEDDFKYVVLETSSKELVEETKVQLKQELGIEEERIQVAKLAVSQCSHMGPNSFGITFFVPLRKIMEKGL